MFTSHYIDIQRPLLINDFKQQTFCINIVRKILSSIVSLCVISQDTGNIWIRNVFGIETTLFRPLFQFLPFDNQRHQNDKLPLSAPQTFGASLFAPHTQRTAKQIKCGICYTFIQKKIRFSSSSGIGCQMTGH